MAFHFIGQVWFPFDREPIDSCPCFQSPGSNTPQSTNYTATCLPSRKLYKLDKPERRTLLEKQGWAHKWCTPMDPAYGQAKAGWPAQTYIQQLCEDTECSPEDLPEAMNDREKWWERVRDIRASSITWWWWWNIPSYLLFVGIEPATSWGFHLEALFSQAPIPVVPCFLLFD